MTSINGVPLSRMAIQRVKELAASPVNRHGIPVPEMCFCAASIFVRAESSGFHARWSVWGSCSRCWRRRYTWNARHTWLSSSPFGEGDQKFCGMPRRLEVTVTSRHNRFAKRSRRERGWCHRFMHAPTLRSYFAHPSHLACSVSTLGGVLRSRRVVVARVALGFGCNHWVLLATHLIVGL